MRAHRLFCLAAFAVLLLAANTCRSQSDGADPDYRTALGQGGRARWYMGREIANVIHHRNIGRMERAGRAVEEATDSVVPALHMPPDAVVADIGAGSGYFTRRLARQVPQGRVYAVELQDALVTQLRTLARDSALHNIQVVPSTVRNANLPPGSIDLALIVDAYHEFSHPYEMIRSIVQALRPGGRLVVLEYRAEDKSLPNHPLHRMAKDQLVREMAAAGLRLADERNHLPRQHMLFFEVAAAP